MASSHETADRRLVEMLTAEAPAAIHWLEELGVEFTRENGGYRLARCGGSSRKRLLQVGDRPATRSRRRCATPTPPRAAQDFPKARSSRSSSARTAGSQRAAKERHELVIDAGAVVLAAGGRCFREAEERGELSTNHPGATGEVTPRDRARRRDARPRCAPVPPERRRVAAEHAGLLDSRNDSRVRRGAAERRGRGVHRLARPARRGLAGDRRGGRARQRRRDAGRPAGGAARHDAHRRGRRRDLAPVHAAALPRRRHRPAAEPILTYPVLHYQNGGLVIDSDAETTLEGLFACGEIAGGTHGRNRMMGNACSSAACSGAAPARPQRKGRHEHGRDRHPGASRTPPRTSTCGR